MERALGEEDLLFLNGESAGRRQCSLLQFVQLLAFVHLLVENKTHFAILFLPGAVGMFVIGHSRIPGIIISRMVTMGPVAAIKIHCDTTAEWDSVTCTRDSIKCCALLAGFGG